MFVRMITLTSLLAIFLTTIPIHAADRVRVHAPARTFVQLPFWIGVDKKIYDAHGLNIEPIVMASPIAVAALARGEIDFLTTGDSAANAIAPASSSRSFLSTAPIICFRSWSRRISANRKISKAKRPA